MRGPLASHEDHGSRLSILEAGTGGAGPQGCKAIRKLKRRGAGPQGREPLRDVGASRFAAPDPV